MQARSQIGHFLQSRGEESPGIAFGSRTSNRAIPQVELPLQRTTVLGLESSFLLESHLQYLVSAPLWDALSLAVSARLDGDLMETLHCRKGLPGRTLAKMLALGP